jgi:hypothetical protein
MNRRYIGDKPGTKQLIVEQKTCLNICIYRNAIVIVHVSDLADATCSEEEPSKLRLELDI